LPDVQGKAIAALIARIDSLENQLQNNNTLDTKIQKPKL
jgi:hypothetical protein